MKPPTNPLTCPDCRREITLEGDEEHDVTTVPGPHGTRQLYIICLVEEPE